MQPTGTIFLPTATAAALFQHELKGQFSDGLWENARPHDHWKFWNGLEVKVAPGRTQVETRWPCECTKDRYNIAALYEYVGDRMLLIGRMAKACEMTGAAFPGRSTVEAMPETLQEFSDYVTARVEGRVTGKHAYEEKHLDKVTMETAVAFYACNYTMREMKRDVKYIKDAMKTARA